MAVSDVLKSLVDYGDPNQITYKAYDFRKVQVVCGVPPVPIHGLDYVIAYHLRPQTRLVGSMTGDGVFISNLNHRGIIEFGLQQDCVSAAVLQILELSGIPIPIAVVDLGTSGFSSVVSSASRRVATPRYRRALVPQLQIYTFACERLLINYGPRQTAG